MRVTVGIVSTTEVDEIAVADNTIKVRPLFYGNGREGMVFVLKSFKEDGTLLSAQLVRVDGRSGKLSVVDRTRPVAPALERPPSEKKVKKPLAAK